MIHYISGDLFSHIPQDKSVIIPHIVNDVGAWGAGFVIPLARHFPLAKQKYLKWSQGIDLKPFRLGQVQYVLVKDNPNNRIWVANMVSQSGIVNIQNTKPIRYAALVKCMESVKDAAYNISPTENVCQILAPKFGAGLAQGNWLFIEELINEIWDDLDVTVFEYELPINTYWIG